MQWFVITALVIGGGIAFYMLMTKTDEYKTQADEQQGNMTSLREQLRQAKNPTPAPSPALPEATGQNANATSTPQPSVTPAPSPSPTPAVTPKP